MSGFARHYELAPVINLSGPLTPYGVSISSPAVAAATAEALGHHWDMDELYQRSGELLARWSGAEAGVLTGCSAAGITLSVAACMTGDDLGRISQLPDISGMKHEVVIQQGHAINFGAPMEQMIRLSGATVRAVGTVNRANPYDVIHGIGPNTAAAMFVVSHHTVPWGYVPLEQYVEICHERGVPVIVAAAAQDQQIARIVASGADLVTLSVQKYLSGPTAGIVCGRKDLVRAIYLQNRGIGRPMKVGKEGIFGAMAAIEERMAIRLEDWASRQAAKAQSLADQIIGLPGVAISLELDKVGQPVTRVRLEVDPEHAGLDAAAVCEGLLRSTPSIKPRAHHTDEGWFLLEPVHVTDDELTFTAERLRAILALPAAEKATLQAAAAARRPSDAFVAWLS